MNGEERTPDSFSWMRRWGAGLNFIITCAAVVALVAMANYLAIRHYARWHFSQEVEARLSRHTRNVLGSLTNAVKIIAYYNTQDPLWPRVHGLLKEYQHASPRVQLQVVDYIRDGAAAKAVKQQYRFAGVADNDLVIFDMNGRARTVYASELSDYDYSQLVAGQTNEVERTAFKGELLFTSRIFSVANERSPIAYFLIGHGEHNPANLENNEGYGKFAALLKDENNFQLAILTLGGTNEVPANCNLLVVAGASTALDRTELDAIQTYLEGGGRMVVLFNSASVKARRPTGLEKLVARWGVEAGENVIYDPENSVTRLDVVPVRHGQHPIVNPLQDLRLQLYMPRSITALPSTRRARDLTIDELLFTGPNAVPIVDLTRMAADMDQRGAKPLAATIERSVPAVQRGSTRIVVLGDSSIFNNQLIEGGANRQFASLIANWLANQTVLLADIQPRPIRTYQLSMTNAQLRSVQMALLAGMPGAALFIGLLVWMRRRN